MRIPEDTIQEIKAQTDIVELISQYVDLKKRGKNWLGLCPFHSEKTPSFTVSQEKQFFHCFGCGAGGDAISFLMKRDNLTYPEAIRALAARKGIVIQGDEREAERASRRESLTALNRLAAQYYYKNLLTERRPKAVLEERGVGYEAINHFLIGYAHDAWDGLTKHLQEKGASTEDAVAIGLLGQSDNGRIYDRFRNRLMFPILDHRGRVIAFGGRAMGDDRAKYLNSPESELFHKGDHLYGLQNISRDNSKDPILLVEGYMDVIALHQAGFKRAVASLGTALTPGQARLLKRYGGRVTILYDGDTAGANAALRACEVLQEAEMEPRIAALEEGMDPDDLLRAHGPKAMEVALTNAKAPPAYALHRARQQHDLASTEGRIGFMEEAAEILAAIPRAFVRDEYLRTTAEHLQVRPEALAQEVERRIKTPGKIGYNTKTTDVEIETAPMTSAKPVSRATKQLWVNVLATAMSDRATLPALAPYLTEEFLTEPAVYTVAAAVVSAYEETEADALPPEALRERVSHDKRTDGVMEAVVRQWKQKDHANATQTRELYRALEREKLRMEKDKLMEEIEWLSGSEGELADVLHEKVRRLETILQALTKGS